mgnify:CR=1 FL=1
MNKVIKKITFWSIIGLISVSSFAFVSGYFEVSKNLDIFTSLFREVNIYYVDETKPGEMIEKAIDSMLEDLDPYTTYIPESDIEDFRFQTTGQYGGIGAMIRKKDDYVVIAEPYKGFPADKAGLRAGDKLIEIDGKSVKGKSTEDVSSVLKGQPGVEVNVLIERPGSKKPIKKTFTREEVKVKSVPYKGMVDDGIAYVRLTRFTRNCASDVEEAILELTDENEVKGLELDLRGNPGGLLNESVSLCNLFIDKNQEVVSTKGKIKDWEKSYTDGLDLLGFKYENRTEPFQGASGATHPVLAEAVTQFQAGAYKELLPSEGPIRTQIVGNSDPQKEAQAQRVKEYMNYELMEKMSEYEPEFDQMLFHLPLAGSTFKKVYYDDLLGRAVSKFVPADELVVPYTATSLDDAESIIHTVKMSENEVLKKQVAGFYREVDILPSRSDDNDIQDKYNQLEGVDENDTDYQFNILEMHVHLDIEEYLGAQTDEKNVKIPYLSLIHI